MIGKSMCDELKKNTYIKREIEKDMNIATPPRRETFPVCTLREFIESYTLYFLQNFIISGIRTTEIINASSEV